MLLIRHELSYIVYFAEILNHKTFPLLRVSELCSKFPNNCGSLFWYSYTTNIRRQTFKSSILKPTRLNSLNTYYKFAYCMYIKNARESNKRNSAQNKF